MIKSVFVSIIMPSLNVAKYIRECIESALNQTLHDIELICIDAGSTDGTWEILQEYARKDERIRLLHSDVRSYGYQVNMGIREARGEFVAVLETDDYIEKEMYEVLYHIAKHSGAEVVKADFDSFVTSGEEERVFFDNRLWKTGDHRYNQLVDARYLDDVYVRDYNIWKGIYKRSFLLNYNILLNETKGAAYQDIGFVQQVIAYAVNTYFSDRSFYRYRMDREESSTNSPNGLKYVHQEFAWLLQKEDFWNNHVNKRGFFKRLIGCFEAELPKTLRALEYDFNAECVLQHYIWIRDVILENAKDCLLEEDDGSTKTVLMMTDLEQYCRELREADSRVEEDRKKLLSFVDGKEIVVFGTGEIGKSAVSFLNRNQVNIVSLMDNDFTLWSTKKYGIIILPPEECVNRYKHKCYVIANKYHALEMKQQLLLLGIQEEQIYLYGILDWL